ncbi:hypothetical protein [Pseudoclavibacter sp. RFBB5]|uniref:hypothetical protein n=1 Tax=Pseudoclavibacter sp. RFBB5 TaxID=2080574 RepID=UPI0011AFE61D|nr:hypothetical protein [Pseudoclavibacter sp. RFBB5]
MFDLGGGTGMLAYLLEPEAGDQVVVVAGAWPLTEALELAQSRVLQLNPVNGLPEFVPARTAEEAAERRASLQSSVQNDQRLRTMSYESLTEEEYQARESGVWNSAGTVEPEEPQADTETDTDVEAMKEAKIQAAFENAKAEAAAAGTPIDEETVEWYVSIVGDGEPNVTFVTEEQRRAFEAEAEEYFDGIAGHYSPMEVTGRLGLPEEVLSEAWNAQSQDALDAAINACENEWHRRMLVRMAEHAALDELMLEFGIETIVFPQDREPTEEEQEVWSVAYSAAMERWELGDFVDEPAAPWLLSGVQLGAPASDAEIIASFEHPTARLQFERVR